MRRLPTARPMLFNIVLKRLDLIPIHIIQYAHHQFNIRYQLIASSSREIFAHHDAKHFQVFSVRCHGVGRDDPGATAQLVRDGEFVVVFFQFWVEAEGNERETSARFLGHDDEA